MKIKQKPFYEKNCLERFSQIMPSGSELIGCFTHLVQACFMSLQSVAFWLFVDFPAERRMIKLPAINIAITKNRKKLFFLIWVGLNL